MDSGLRRSSSMTISSSIGRSFRRISCPTQHLHLLRHEALRRDHGFTSVCRIHNVLSWFTAAQTGITFLTVADASVLEGLDEYIVTVDVEQNSTRPELTLARNLWALPKRGGTRLFATVTVRTVATGSSLLSGVTVFAKQAARAKTSFPNLLPVMFKGYVMVPHMHPASHCVHLLLTGLVAVFISSFPAALRSERCVHDVEAHRDLSFHATASGFKARRLRATREVSKARGSQRR